MSPKRRRVLLFALIPIALYLLMCGGLWLLQDSMVFPGAGGPRENLVVPDGVSVGELARADGTRFRLATAIPREPAAVLLFFVGNGENLHSGVLRAEDLARYGVAVLVPEYPGYGETPGRASVESLLEVADAAAVHAQRTADQLGVDLVVGGSSLGTFLAVHVAAQGIGRRLLLQAPPTSLAEVGQARFPFLPVGWLLRHRFDSASLAPEVRCPSLVVHGERDTTVPPEYGRRLSELFGGPSEFLLMPGHGHNHPSLSVESPAGPAVRAFLRGE